MPGGDLAGAWPREDHWFQRVLQDKTDRPRLFKRDDDTDANFTGAVADPAVVQEALGWGDLGRDVPLDDRGSLVTPL